MFFFSRFRLKNDYQQTNNKVLRQARDKRKESLSLVSKRSGGVRVSQVGAPFGTDLGGVNPQFWALNADSQYDSWLTVGITQGCAGHLSDMPVLFALLFGAVFFGETRRPLLATRQRLGARMSEDVLRSRRDSGGALSSIGVDFANWGMDNGINCNDGAIFWMNPDDGPSAQNTPSSCSCSCFFLFFFLFFFSFFSFFFVFFVFFFFVFFFFFFLFCFLSFQGTESKRARVLSPQVALRSSRSSLCQAAGLVAGPRRNRSPSAPKVAGTMVAMTGSSA